MLLKSGICKKELLIIKGIAHGDCKAELLIQCMIIVAHYFVQGF